ncbi:MAG TPA: UDP-N-acetylmuramate dehydrogenase [Acidimicrobiia bacterium]|nr:UDP-N-acetylmuramate dehydrogenase [Acidimicrobiia bacterium]
MTARELLAAAARLREDVPLAPLTTYRFGGPARYLVEAETEEDLVAAARLAAEEHLPVFVLGRGSNVVVSDRGFAGVVIRQGTGFARRTMDRGGVISAGAAVPLPVLAREAARAGRGGLEFFVGIPGSVGGAVRMNAGCHGSDTGSRLITARIVSLRSGAVGERAPTDLELSYRHSNLSDEDVVVSARFHTDPVDPQEAELRIREITRWRKETQPGGTLNAGSVFKNPAGDAAGRIIDSLGLKGLRVGAVEVSMRHANFFVADAGATAADVYALVGEVQRRVHESTGIVLEPELRFVGEFD